MTADNSHAARKIAKRRAAADLAILEAYRAPFIAAAVAAYDNAGGIANAWKARTIATAFLADELRTTLDTAAELLADALAVRAAARPQPGDSK